MATDTWPSGLPDAPRPGGFREVVPRSSVRTQMDVGPAKLRRRSTGNVRFFQCIFELTLAQVATLDTFFITTLTGGSEAYNFDHPRTGATAEYRFLEPPSYSNPEGGDLWIAVCNIELLP